MKVVVWFLLAAVCFPQGKVKQISETADTNIIVNKRGNLSTFLPEYFIQVHKSQKVKDPSRYFPMNTEYLYSYCIAMPPFTPFNSVEYACIDEGKSFCEFTHGYGEANSLYKKMLFAKSKTGIFVTGVQSILENHMRTNVDYAFLPFPLKLKSTWKGQDWYTTYTVFAHYDRYTTEFATFNDVYEIREQDVSSADPIVSYRLYAYDVGEIEFGGFDHGKKTVVWTLFEITKK